MQVHKLGYTARIEINFSAVENWQPMHRYMERNGWKSIGLGGKEKLVQDRYNSMSYYAYSKEFTDISTMQREMADIEDAFNR